MKQGTIEFLARMKARQTRGGSWIQFLLNIGVVTANIALFSDWLDSIGIPAKTALIAAPIGYVVATVVIGYIDEFYGIWQDENEYNSKLNPFLTKLKKQVEDLQKECE